MSDEQTSKLRQLVKSWRLLVGSWESQAKTHRAQAREDIIRAETIEAIVHRLQQHLEQVEKKLIEE